MLRIQDISLTFENHNILDKINTNISEAYIYAIIGPNGAGKTSLVNCISGFYKPQKGNIFFKGENITRMRPDRITRLGIGRTFQNIELYHGLTVLDNLMAARQLFMKYSFLNAGIYFGGALKEEIKHRERVEEIIDFLELTSIRYHLVESLSYGQRKKVELGRAIALEPKLLILDEPLGGMNIEEKEDMARYIIDINEENCIPIILIEHDMGVVMDVSEYVIVLDFGKIIAEGPPNKIKSDPAVISAYLGKELK